MTKKCYCKDECGGLRYVRKSQRAKLVVWRRERNGRFGDCVAWDYYDVNLLRDFWELDGLRLFCFFLLLLWWHCLSILQEKIFFIFIFWKKNFLLIFMCVCTKLKKKVSSSIVFHIIVQKCIYKEVFEYRILF